jgi:hypothetical protein
VTISVYDVVARYKDISYLTAVIFFLALYFLVKAIFIFIDNKEVSKKEYYFTVPAISVYTLWSSLATIVNVSSSLLKLGYKGEPMGIQRYASKDCNRNYRDTTGCFKDGLRKSRGETLKLYLKCFLAGESIRK